MKKIILLTLVICFLSGFVYAGGLITLIKVGWNQNAMQKELNIETKSFEKLKKAIKRGALKEDEAQSAIKARYGEPVLIFPDKEYAEKWIYKPDYATWFDGIKIYLFFDSDKKLRKIKEMFG